MRRSRREQLWDRLAESYLRNVGFTEFRPLIESFGFKLRPVSGSHYIYTHPQVPRPLSLQPRDREAKALPNLSIPRHGSGIRPDDRALTIIPKYHINLFWSESDGAGVADVPDLQSCSAVGETPTEALAEIEQAIKAWLAAAREDGLLVAEFRYHAPTRIDG
jgi:predicted RNase H-like HicB family nuclease